MKTAICYDTFVTNLPPNYDSFILPNAEMIDTLEFDYHTSNNAYKPKFIYAPKCKFWLTYNFETTENQILYFPNLRFVHMNRCEDVIVVSNLIAPKLVSCFGDFNISNLKTDTYISWCQTEVNNNITHFYQVAKSDYNNDFLNVWNSLVLATHNKVIANLCKEYLEYCLMPHSKDVMFNDYF